MQNRVKLVRHSVSHLEWTGKGLMIDWSMPGGIPSNAAPAAAPAQFPSSGGFRLGGEDDVPSNGGGGAPQTGRGGYQTID